MLAIVGGVVLGIFAVIVIADIGLGIIQAMCD